MNKFNEIFLKLELRIVHYVCGTLLLFSLLYVTANVLGRYLFNTPLPLVSELVGAILVPIIFLSLSDGWRKKGTFVAAEFLLSKMTGKLRWWFDLSIELFALLCFTAILGYAAVLETVYKYKTNDVLGSLGEYFPSWPFELSIVIGFGMLAVRHLLNIIFHVKGYHNADSR